MFSKDELKEIIDYINDNPTAKIYIGADSQRSKHKKVKFVTVLVVYQKDKSKIFKDVIHEKITDAKLSRPFNRLFREVVLVHELYTLLEDILMDREFEIHLDINSNEREGSNVAYGAAMGYITSYIGVKPITKPFSWAASCVADRFSK